MPLSCPTVPNEYQVVPILAPQNRRCSARKDFPNLLKVGPLPVLYQHLIPPKKKDLKKKSLQAPPLIHCGYVAEEEFLFGYAHHHGLLQECLGIHEGETVLLELDTMYAAVKSILTELKISSIPIRLPVVVAHGGVTRVIALYNNYSMENIPTGEDIQELAQYLGKEQEQPRWYFDATHWRWN